MKYNLTIFKDDNTEQGTRLSEFRDVDIQWDRSGGLAERAGETLAKSHAYDDFPVEIKGDRLIIQVQLPDGDSGRWELVPVTIDDLLGEWNWMGWLQARIPAMKDKANQFWVKQCIEEILKRKNEQAQNTNKENSTEH